MFSGTKLTHLGPWQPSSAGAGTLCHWAPSGQNMGAGRPLGHRNQVKKDIMGPVKTPLGSMLFPDDQRVLGARAMPGIRESLWWVEGKVMHSQHCPQGKGCDLSPGCGGRSNHPVGSGCSSVSTVHKAQGPRGFLSGRCEDTTTTPT